MDFGDKLRRVRRAKDISQAQICEQLGITIKHLSLIENNHSRPSYELLMKLIRTLDVRADVLLNDDDHVSAGPPFKTKT